ncbi:hypothetical protein KQX54_000402 [Cotesia glomerata]|uniref:Uncharacterized protein n=1 Tax=Cotesia glomerata TaxID=32391 RepID=A0AAV7I5N2_COTGL|nr:hypothetical protein KQX54_000402 [Cotesia glomerata]
MENFSRKSLNNKIVKSIMSMENEIDITKKPPTPGKLILKYFPEDYVKFNQPLPLRELFVPEQEEEPQQEEPEDRAEEQNIPAQPVRLDRMAQRYNFSVLPRDSRPIAIPKFRNVNRGVFFENSEINRTQANTRRMLREEPAHIPDPMEDRLKGVLERLKSRLKEMNPGKRKPQVLDVIQPAPKKRKELRRTEDFTALCYSFSHFCEVKEVTDVV